MPLTDEDKDWFTQTIKLSHAEAREKHIKDDHEPLRSKVDDLSTRIYIGLGLVLALSAVLPYLLK